MRFCIIGAGACGLAVAKTFAERGISFDCFEALSDVGGIWNPESPHVVYGSTYLNSSKKLSRYPDFHFPEEWAPYASRAQAQDYLRAYAKEFGLYQLISFNKRVTRAERTRARLARADRGRGRAAPLCRARRRQRASLGGGRPHLSRPVRRRDAAFPRREVEGAGQGQARAGGGRGQLGGRYLVRCRDREWARRAFDAPDLLFLPQDGVRQADRRVHRLHQPDPAAAQIDAAVVSLGHAHRGRPASPLRPGAAGPRSVRGASHRLQHLYRSPHPWPHDREARHRAARRQARDLHRRQRGRDRFSGLGHRLSG